MKKRSVKKPKQSPQDSSALIGRTEEIDQMRVCIELGKNVLLEGPVGVGKTSLALSVIEGSGRPVFRVDGDSRYSEQKLTGWFDPPAAIRLGFNEKSFIPGPLTEAMRSGGILFINELNRMPEGVQNVLLPAIDEKQMTIPKLGEIRARSGFVVVATQNPKEFVATSHLSEAILDRFEWIALDYQTEAEELQIVAQKVKSPVNSPEVRFPVKLTRLTRELERIRRPASVRAAMSIAEICKKMTETGMEFSEAFLKAALLALPTRIEIQRDADVPGAEPETLAAVIREWVNEVLSHPTGTELKKKNSESRVIN